MSKEGKLKELEAEIAADKTLPLRESNLVFGEGNVDCDVMFIGEAPGLNEDLQKRPFVGRGGQLLNKMLEGAGIKREEVYITNIVKRRPPNNRDPLPEEISAYRPYLTGQIEIINPKIIATLGRFSMNYFNEKLKISRDHGKIFRMNGRLLVPFCHPAAVLRNPNLLDEYRREFRRLPKIVTEFEELLRKT
jgi:DNA polymerase